ncbi:hypothetical protein DPMN_154191 [Dreissena polymorpha]|uniref:Protein kinase domain-containing protein n=1 Tax=Dreissena polymorpha TaxID=45954 RepID=A0A9D4FKI8_DREPO|nr:hypothetical protein DPMN_154191 [Dreissena polymorpha]
MACNTNIFTEKETNNWIKASIALNVTREGLANFLNTQLQNVHAVVGRSCGLCPIEKLIPCPTNPYCKKIKRNNCAFHKSQKPQPCPTCDNVKQNIILLHRYGRPSLKNTRAEKWALDYWEIGKCYLPPDGYSSVSSVLESDFNGVISIMLNCLHFQTCLSSSFLSPPPPDNQCQLEKVRQIGREVRHTANCQVTDADLQDYFLTLSTLLADPICLQHDPSAMIACTKLRDLQNDSISLDTLGDLLKEAYQTLNDAKEAGQRYSEMAERSLSKGLKRLENAIQVGQQRLESKTNIGEQRMIMKTHTVEEGIQIAYERFESMIQLKEQRLEHEKKVVKQRIESKIHEVEQCIESDMHDGMQRIERKIRNAEQSIESNKHDAIQRIENKNQLVEQTIVQNVIGERMKHEANETSKAGYERVVSELRPKKECTHVEVEHEIKKIGKHIHDGRLVELSRAYIEHVKDCLSDPGSIEQGGYGTVYITRKQVDGFRQRIVLKELSVDDSPESRREDKVHILASVTNEKLASRIMHFAIVPLIAYHDDLEKGKYYFIAPYLEKGDLYAAIQSDRKLLVESPPSAEYIPVLHWKHRLKIMFQIACAIDYLHTGNSFRGTILHMDIKSKNVVVDSELNARLIDFGLAREVKEGEGLQTSTPVYGTKGYFPTVEHKRLTPEHDYHNFGIVIRELLTGVDPTECAKDDAIQLRKWDSRRVGNSIHDRVWPKEFNTRQKIRALADKCIDSIKKEGTLKSKGICDELKDIMRTNGVKTWKGWNDQRCEICMVNEHDAKSPVAAINHKDCPGKIKICHACMRNSYFNPIKCHTCDNDIKAVIGDGWGAVLIAGYDEHEANLFKKDVTAFGDAITSTVLPTMCISKSNLVVVDCNTKSEESASSRIEKAFKILESKHVHTLVFLYSGHNSNFGFQIGRTSTQDEKSEYLFYHIDELCKCIEEINGLEKVILFLDCCYAKPLNVPDHICLIQFNATGPNDKTEVIGAKGSIFTRYLVQAFTMKASGEKCKLHDYDCSITGDFITLGSLWDYILRHSQHDGMEKEKMTPYQNTKNVCLDTMFLAYNYNFEVKFCFDVRVPDENINQMIEVLPRQLTEFRAFKRDILFPACFDMLTNKMNIQASLRPAMSKYAEILVIEVDGGPKHTQEIDNMEKLLLAWYSKRLFRCRFRQCTEIDQERPVGVVLRNGNNVCEILSHLNPEQHPRDIDGLEELMTALDTEEGKIHPESVQPLKLFNDKLSALLHAAKENKVPHFTMFYKFLY